MRPYLVAIACLIVFYILGVRHLDVVPQVYEDEPWQASTAYKLLTTGVFGSDMFAGFHAMDQRYYGFMPLHPLVETGFLWLFGLGLAQARLETVTLSLISLGLTFALAVRLFNAWVGAVAVAVLVCVRWTGLTYVQLTGIPVVDLARIARYDPLVPVVGLAGLHAYISARVCVGSAGRRRAWYLLAGILAGLAGLAHVYGLFWVLALLVLVLWDRRPRAMGWLLLGAVLPWLPYAVYVALDLPDWRGQTRMYGNRFELLNPRWYLSNLVGEYHRYGPGLGPFGPGWLLRVGFWFLLVSLPVSMWFLARRALAGDQAARVIVVPSILFPVLFALVITEKLVNYTLVELPLFAIVVGWGVTSIWRRRRWRPALAVLTVALLVEGGWDLSRLELAALTTTPYPTFIAEVHQYVPPGSHVLGLHSYWFGFEDDDYRSFLLPLLLADEGLPLDQALDQVDPNVVLLDARMRAYFDSPPVAGDAQLFKSWLSAHDARVIGRVDDPTYGLMEVYSLQR